MSKFGFVIRPEFPVSFFSQLTLRLYSETLASFLSDSEFMNKQLPSNPSLDLYNISDQWRLLARLNLTLCCNFTRNRFQIFWFLLGIFFFAFMHSSLAKEHSCN